MKFLILALLVALTACNSYPGYIINYAKNGAFKPQAAQESYTQQSFSDLLKHNFQVLGDLKESQQIVNEFGKGSLLEPVQLNYMIVVEGAENTDALVNQPRISIEKDAQYKLIDQIFDYTSSNSLLRLTENYFPKEKRVPFYYYKSQAVAHESAYERPFGIELKRDLATNEVYFFDNQTQQQIGQKFEIQQCFAKNFPGFRLLKDKIIKNQGSLKLDITETNVKSVEFLLKDLCAASRLSTMFRKSAQPNFVAFALNFKDLESEPLVQELVKVLYKNVSKNFEKALGAENVFGQVIYVPELEDVESSNYHGEMTPRFLQEDEEEEGNDVQPQVTDEEGNKKAGEINYSEISSNQFRAWFSLFFGLLIFFVCYGLFTAEQSRDTLLYAKFIAADH